MEKTMKHQFIKTFITSSLVLASFIFSTNAFAESKEEAISKLDRLNQDFESLKYTAMRPDVGRIIVLQKRIGNVKQLVTDKDVGNMKTINAYQELVLTIKYSQAFLNTIRAASVDSAIRDIEDLNKQIIKDRGFDEEITTQLVAGILSDVYNLAQQIKGQGVPEDLERWLTSDLTKATGHALASAKANGDVPAAYSAGAKVCSQIRSKYAKLAEINSRSPAYQMVTQLMGLVEFFFEINDRGQFNKKEAQ